MEYKKKFLGRYADGDKKGKISVKAIMEIMLEASFHQGNELNDKGNKEGIWVLYQWHIDFIDYPKAQSKFLIETKVVGVHKFYAFRKFLMKKEGKIIAKANTIWLFISKENKRPQRIAEDFKKLYGLENDGEKIKILRQEKIKDFDFGKKYEVNSYFIDTNEHANNLAYISWIIDSLGREFYQEKELKSLILNYQQEIFEGENIVVKNKIIDNIVHHQINDEYSNLRAWAKTIWK